MSEVLVQVTRGDFTESKHRGFIAVTDGEGKLIASAGNPDEITFMRSAAKPLQALAVLFSGAAERYGFSEKELALMCASHYGEDMHREVLAEILRKIGLGVSDLNCGAPRSISGRYREQQLWDHLPIDASNSSCSGKHGGFLSVCGAKGYPPEDYIELSHPVQQEVLDILAYICSVKREDLQIGIDGCGVPVHGMKLRNMAVSYARLANPSGLREPYPAACAKIVSAMNAYPEMVAGTGGFCTELMKHTGGRFCAKLGAEAVYCIGVVGKDIGIAVKIEDGSNRALYPSVMSVLMQMELLEEEEIEALRRFIEPDNKNNHGRVIGKVSPCFRLRFAER